VTSQRQSETGEGGRNLGTQIFMDFFGSCHGTRFFRLKRERSEGKPPPTTADSVSQRAGTAAWRNCCFSAVEKLREYPEKRHKQVGGAGWSFATTVKANTVARTSNRRFPGCRDAANSSDSCQVSLLCSLFIFPALHTNSTNEPCTQVFQVFDAKKKAMKRGKRNFALPPNMRQFRLLFESGLRRCRFGNRRSTSHIRRNWSKARDWRRRVVGFEAVLTGQKNERNGAVLRKFKPYKVWVCLFSNILLITWYLSTKKISVCSVKNLKTVFFGVFAAAEPSANVCVAHGTYAMIEVSVLLFVTNEMGRNVASMFYFYVSTEPF